MEGRARTGRREEKGGRDGTVSLERFLSGLAVVVHDGKYAFSIRKKGA